MEPGDGGGQDRLHPHRARGDAEAAGTAGDGGLDLPEDMARAFGGHGPERGEPDAQGQALEQRSPRPGLEPGDEAEPLHALAGAAVRAGAVGDLRLLLYPPGVRFTLHLH